MHLALIDGQGFIFRAFHAFPPLTRPSDGQPVGAVYGYCKLLRKLLRTSSATHIAVVFDKGRSQRQKLYPLYKAHRAKAPDAITSQYPLVREATEAFGVAVAELPGYEADDVIATLALRFWNRGQSEVTIISSDKDFMQLIRPGLSLHCPMKDRCLDDDVHSKFGVAPDKVVDVQALIGDAADNIPGVPGIGKVTAAALINWAGSLERLFMALTNPDASPPCSPARRKAIIDNAPDARTSKQLATLQRDVPITLTEMDYVRRERDGRALAAFMQRMEFVSLSAELEGAA